VFDQVTQEVVGVAFATLQEAEGHGYIIPTSVLLNFLRVFEATGDFAALPSLGLQVQALTNPSMRKQAFDGKPDHHDGVLVTALAPFSCAKSAGVQIGDVLMSLDGSAVSEGGEVVFRGHERVHHSHLYTKKMIGESVRLSLLRREEGVRSLVPLEIDVSLTSGKNLVPRELWKDYPRTMSSWADWCCWWLVSPWPSSLTAADLLAVVCIRLSYWLRARLMKLTLTMTLRPRLSSSAIASLTNSMLATSSLSGSASRRSTGWPCAISLMLRLCCNQLSRRPLHSSFSASES